MAVGTYGCNEGDFVVPIATQPVRLRLPRAAGGECLPLGNTFLIRNPDASPSAQHDTGKLVCKKMISHPGRRGPVIVVEGEETAGIMAGWFWRHRVNEWRIDLWN